MRLSILVAAMAVTLAACAEVAPMRNPDGSVEYYINCDLTLRLESCRSAMSRICPNGYDLKPARPASKPDPENAEPPDHPAPKPPNDGLFRCRG